MKRITRIILFGSIALMGFQLSPLAAHDGWVEIAPAIVERNQPATIALIQGNHSNEHKSYRIAGKWNAKYVTLAVVEPKGKQISLTDRLFDMGEDEEKIGPKGPKGFHLAPFTPQEDGFFHAYAKQVRIGSAGRWSEGGQPLESPRPHLPHSRFPPSPRLGTSKALTGRSAAMT